MTRTFCSGMPKNADKREPQHVRDLGRRPERDLVADPLRDHRARFHRARDQPLLPVVALEHDRRVAEGGVHVAVGEDPLVALVAGLVHLGRVRRPARCACRAPAAAARSPRRSAASASAAVYRSRATTSGHGLADVADLVDRHRRVRRDEDVRRHRPRARQAALLGGEVGAGEGGDHAGLVERAADVDPGDLRVRVRAAQEGHVQHAGQLDVVGPVGLAGDQLGVFLAQPGPADLGGGAAAVVVAVMGRLLPRPRA